jgi:membrane-bound lytic murein transglycosylase D
MIQQQLRDAGLPLDLAYLPMIESGYSLTAYSKARAVGPWQFIRSTGRLYGLTINNYVDERRDPIKSTRAAITFLSDLYAKFGSWHLAVAAYNAGPGKVNRAVKRGKTTNFWKLAQGRHLRLETKRYVPKLIAAIIIAKNPEKYGFTDIQYEEPLAFEYVKVPRWTSLQAASIACNTPIKELRNLNRELRKGITPPGSSYQLKVPPGKLAIVEKNLPRVHATVSTKYKTHIVKENETLSRVCKRYHIEKTTLLKANDLREPKLISGQRLRIPFRTTTYRLLAENELPGTPDSLNLKNLVEHEVETGETLSTIASRYGVPPHMIAAWNDIKNLHWIRAGQRLTLFVEDNALTSAGDTRTAAGKSKIARIESSEAASGSTANLTDSAPVSSSTYYMVRGGDTLWDIAKKYNTTPRNIRRWNQIEGDTIRPGRRLLLKVAQKDV